MSGPYAPAEGFEVAGKEDKCAQCKERDLLQTRLSVQPGQHTVNLSPCTVYTSLLPQLLFFLLQVCAYGPLIHNGFSSRLMRLVRASHHFQCQQLVPT